MHMRSPLRPVRPVSLLLGTCTLLIAGCSSSPALSAAGSNANSAQLARQASPPSISIDPTDGSQDVRVDAQVTASIDHGTLDTVVVHSSADPTPLPGQASADGHVWKLTAPLDPATTYLIAATGHDSAGNQSSAQATFTTMEIRKRLTTNPYPNDGDVVGVGMPIILRFNEPIAADKQTNLLQHITVVTDPQVPGAWHWFGDSEVHYRPKDYWPSNTKVTVTASLKGVDAGNEVWGMGDWSESFTIGEKHLSIIDATTHQMQVYANDQLVHTYPVSTGREPRFPTLGGTLFVWYKSQKVHMDSLTLGIPHNSPLGYNEDVFWDTAISTDGFFIHSAPWSVWAQGNTNVSHGCVNLSEARAIEFFNFSRIGDVVQVKGTSRTADAGDGEADWQIPFDQYANSGGAQATPAPSQGASGGL